MSVLLSTPYPTLMSPYTPGHIRSRSYNELLLQFKASITSLSPKVASPVLAPPTQKLFYVKKRSYSDLINDSTGLLEASATKRSRTAPPSPPSPASPSHELKHPPLPLPDLRIHSERHSHGRTARCRSSSPSRNRFNPPSPSNSPKSSPVSLPPRNPSVSVSPKATLYENSPNAKITLPSIASALRAPLPPIKLHPITPTVSLDYFDTYKPNDKNWRYELLDTINRGSKTFNLNQYNYLNKGPSPALSSSFGGKPRFDSRISSKIRDYGHYSVKKPTVLPGIKYMERKINFPYESNYTYLNKTYMNDVEKYPEYLELAQLLIQLSKPPQFNSYTKLSPPVFNPLVSPMAQTYSEQTGLNVTLPSSTILPGLRPTNATQAFASMMAENTASPPREKHTKFIPITPPSAKSKSRSELLKLPPKSHLHAARVCISCGSDQSPCWRPSWSIKEGQLCNSCGLRYKKTSTRCLKKSCKKIPAKGEWLLMQSKGKTTFDDGSEGYSCLDCGGKVEVKK